jgi:hypothetical protein
VSGRVAIPAAPRWTSFPWGRNVRVVVMKRGWCPLGVIFFSDKFFVYGEESSGCEESLKEAARLTGPDRC